MITRDSIRAKAPWMFDKDPWAKYLQVGDGWLPIIDELVDKILRRTKKWKSQKDFHFTQIKEKFGTLRIYWHACHPKTHKTARAFYRFEDIDEYISEAEDQSSRTCEMCGKPAIVGGHGGYWITTLCEECFKR